MGGAMVSGWTKGRNPVVPLKNLLIVDPQPGEAAQTVIDTGAAHQAAVSKKIASAKYVLLAIKPQSFAEAGEQIAQFLPAGAIVISVLAGTTMASLERTFPDQICVRCMPNTPSSIGKGITGFYAPGQLEAEPKAHITELLQAGGEVIELSSEAQIDAVTAISGSGPAYFFHMVEALAAAGQSIGLSEEMAGKLARQTLIGAGALLEKSGQSARELRRNVTSPGGTTQAALDVLMQSVGLPPVIREAVTAAYRRSQELGKEKP
ncbi:MAG: pyrroline-5-carboxylate reductase [Hellea sp.]|nr:pyrroline-5-carboxylate reductase [Hellea sp.]